MKRDLSARNVGMAILAVALSGCATTSKYEKTLQGWVGKDIQSVIQTLGRPEAVTPLPDGNKEYSWFLRKRIKGYTYYDHYSHTTYDLDSKKWCRTTLTVDPANRIQRWRWDGNACQSR